MKFKTAYLLPAFLFALFLAGCNSESKQEKAEEVAVDPNAVTWVPDITEALAKAKARAAQLAELIVTLSVKTGSEGRLFGSVGTADIADAVSAAGIELDKHEVKLPAGPIRQIGEYDVDIHLHGEIKAQIRVNIIAEA